MNMTTNTTVNTASIRTALATCLLLASISTAAHAQAAADDDTQISQALESAQQQVAPLQAAPGSALTQMPAPQAAPPQKFDRNAYPQTNWSTLIKVYWRMNQLDTNKDEDIDNTLRVLECPIYQKYTSDDFEWNEIRNAMRKKITMQKNSWPTTVSFMQPIELEEYNPNRHVFPIVKQMQWNNVYRMQIAGNNAQQENPCTTSLMSGGIPNMPSNASLRLSRPFKLTELPLNDEMAKTYIDFINARAKQNNGYTDRVVYARFYVTLDRYVGKITQTSGAVRDNLGEFLGQIDRIEVYADQTMQRPIYYKVDNFTTAPQLPNKGDQSNKPALIDTTKAINPTQ